MPDHNKPTSLFAELAQKYKSLADAEALFFTPSPPSHAQVKALRILVRTINKEFADNALFGKNHTGNFYYNDIQSLDQAVYYNLKHVENPSDKKVCAWVRFSETEDSEIIAEFLGYDLDGTVDDLDYSHSGTWNALTFGNSVKAIIQKDEDAHTLTFDAAPSIRYKAKLTFLPSLASSAEVLQKPTPPLAVAGMIHYKDYASIKTSSWADFDSNRIVFYVGDFSAKEYTGFFIPSKPLEEIGKSIGLPPLQTALFSVTEPS